MKPNKLLTRRQALIAGAAALGGLILLPKRGLQLPPTYGNILRMGDVLTYGAHRTLLSGRALAKEYTPKDTSSFPATGTTHPDNELWGRLQRGAFADWRLSIEGLVARPSSFSLADLKRFPSRTQSTRHTCEEGWSAIAQWTGVPLSRVLESAGILPNARVVNFLSFDGWTDGIDLIDAFHAQTILAYGMNGRDLPIPHGAPVRLRVETQLGYRSMKYLQRIVVTDSLDLLEKSGTFKSGWAWYAGI